MVTDSLLCYLVDDETVIECDYKHRVILYITLDKTKAIEFVRKKGYTDLVIREVSLDKEVGFVADYGVIETERGKGN